MPRKQPDSSAVRKNRLPNDTAANEIVEAITSMWNAAGQAEAISAELGRTLLSRALHAGFALRAATPATWEAFLRHPLWTEHPKRRPKANEQEDAPKFCLHILFGRSTRATKRTSDCWRAIQQLELEGLSRPQLVREMLKGEANLRSICRRFAEHRRQATAGSAEATAARLGAMPPSSFSSSPAEPAIVINASTRREEVINKGAMQLNFPRGLGDLGSLAIGETFSLTFEALAGGGSVYEAKLIKINPLKSK